MERKYFLATMLMLSVLCTSISAQVYRKFNPDEKMKISIDSKIKMTSYENFQIAVVTEKMWNEIINEAKKQKIKYTGLSNCTGNSESAYAKKSAWEIIAWCNLLSECNGYEPCYVDEQGSPYRKSPRDVYDFFLEQYAFGGEKARKGFLKANPTNGYRLPSYDKIQDYSNKKYVTLLDNELCLVQEDEAAVFVKKTGVNQAVSVRSKKNYWGVEFEKNLKFAGMGDAGQTSDSQPFSNYYFYIMKTKN